MEFFITRTSTKDGYIDDNGDYIYQKTKKPCEEARSYGDNWIIAFDNIKEIIMFCEKNGRVVIDVDSGNDVPSIEIYDDYRE